MKLRVPGASFAAGPKSRPRRALKYVVQSDPRGGPSAQLILDRFQTPEWLSGHPSGTPETPKVASEGLQNKLGRATRVSGSLPNLFLDASGPENGNPGSPNRPGVTKSGSRRGPK